MRSRTSNDPPPPALRRGFTMLELLAVIGIIALIMSTFVLVFANYIESAKVQATRTTIAKIDAILKQRMNALRQQDLTDAANRLVGSGIVASTETGKALALKRLMRFNFPQQRLDNASGTANPPAPFQNITSTWVTNNPNAESAAYLYAIITKGATYGTPTVDDSSFLSSETQTIDNVVFFVDAWGQPLRYFRSPTRLFWQGEDDDFDGTLDRTPTAAELVQYQRARRILAPQTDFSTAGALIHPLRVDPDDQLYRLRSLLVGTAPNIDVPTWNTFETTFQTPATYSTPLIMSVGRDGVLGFLSPGGFSELGNTVTGNGQNRCRLEDALVAADDATLLDPITDNITNLNSQTLGGN